MQPHLIVQASGALELNGDQWIYRFAILVKDEEGIPVEGLHASNFYAFDLMNGPRTILSAVDVNLLDHSFNVPGIYYVNTSSPLHHRPDFFPPLQQLVVLRILEPKSGRMGLTTVAITYLGAPRKLSP